jgi:hypothetical protein
MLSASCMRVMALSVVVTAIACFQRFECGDQLIEPVGENGDGLCQRLDGCRVDQILAGGAEMQHFSFARARHMAAQLSYIFGHRNPVPDRGFGDPRMGAGAKASIWAISAAASCIDAAGFGEAESRALSKRAKLASCA